MWLLLVLAFATIAHAEPVVSLPLDGYYRPGKFFPVKVESERDVDVRVEADGISSRGRGRNIILPAMSLSRGPGVVRVTVDGRAHELSIRPLEPGQPLPVKVTPDPAAAQAYESADMPAEAPRGPSSSLDSAAAYDAAAAFIAERPAGTRRTVWLATALFALLATGVALLRGRYTAYAVAGVAVAWTIGAAVVYARSPAITERAGWVILREGDRDLAQHQWIFRTAATTVQDSFTAAPEAAVRPLLAGDRLELWIEVVENGWRYHYTLTPGAKAIFVFHGPNQGPLNHVPVGRSQTPVMMDIARKYYQRAGDALESLGQFEKPPVRAEVVRVIVAPGTNPR